MSEFDREERDRRTEEAKERYRESIEHVSQDEIQAAAMSGEAKIRKLEKAIPQALEECWSDVKSLVSMIRDYASGDYRDIPFGAIAAAAAAVLYFVSPIDAIPDFIPLVGYIDDAAVIALCLRMIHSDLEKYRERKDRD